jgi:hypothetical protein
MQFSIVIKLKDYSFIINNGLIYWAKSTLKLKYS